MRFKVFFSIAHTRFLLLLIAAAVTLLPACRVSGKGEITPSPTTAATNTGRTNSTDTGTGTGTNTGTGTGTNTGTGTGTNTGTATMGGGNPNNAPPAPPQDGGGMEKCNSPVCTPKRIMASRCKDKVRLTWSLIPSAAKYKVFRTEGSSVVDVGCTSDKHCQNIAITTEAYHEDIHISKNANYVYVVRAMNKEGALSELSPAVVSLKSDVDCVEHPGPNNIYHANEHIGLAGECTAFAFDPNHAYTLFLGHRDGGMLTSLDAGSHWMRNSSGLGNGHITDIVVDPHNNANVYVGTQKGVYASFDYGVTWKPTAIKTAVVPGIQLVNINNKRCIYVPTGAEIKWRCDLKSEIITEGAWSTVGTPGQHNIRALNNVKCITKEKKAKCLCQCADDKNQDLSHFVFHAVLNNHSAYAFDAKTGSPAFSSTAIQNGSANAKVHAMHADKNDPNHFVYLEHGKAIYETRDAGNTFTSIVSSSLGDGDFTQVLVDSHDAEGKTIWFAGPKGIRRYNSGAVSDIHMELPDKTTFNPPVSRIMPNVLWKVGFCGQKGLYYYDYNKLIIAHGTLKTNHVQSFYAGTSSPKLLATVSGYNEGLAPQSNPNSWGIWSKDIKNGDQITALPCAKEDKICVLAVATAKNANMKTAVRASQPGETALKAEALGALSTVITDKDIESFLPNTLVEVPGTTKNGNYVWMLGKTKNANLVAVRGVYNNGADRKKGKDKWQFNIFPMSQALESENGPHQKKQYKYHENARVLPIPAVTNYIWVIDGTNTLRAAAIGELTKTKWDGTSSTLTSQDNSALFLAPASSNAKSSLSLKGKNEFIFTAAVNPNNTVMSRTIGGGTGGTNETITHTTMAGLILTTNGNIYAIKDIFITSTLSSTSFVPTYSSNLTIENQDAAGKPLFNLFTDTGKTNGFGSFNGFTTLNKALIAYSPDGKRVVLVIHATKGHLDRTGVFIADTKVLATAEPQNIDKTTKWTDITRDAALVVPTQILWSGTDFYMATEGSSILKWPALGK